VDARGPQGFIKVRYLPGYQTADKTKGTCHLFVTYCTVSRLSSINSPSAALQVKLMCRTTLTREETTSCFISLLSRSLWRFQLHIIKRARFEGENHALSMVSDASHWNCCPRDQTPARISANSALLLLWEGHYILLRDNLGFPAVLLSIISTTHAITDSTETE
jgi:hypothetical protein